jgi:hypothetical protein
MTEIDKSKLDPAFYVWENDHEEVWAVEGNPFFVVRNGEMRIITNNETEDRVVIRYTDQLYDFGIKNDKDLEEWSKKEENEFSWVHNAWFEIYSINDREWYSEPYHDLVEAIGQAEVMFAEYPDGIIPE